MFGRLRGPFRRQEAVSAAVEDVEITLLRTFSYLSEAAIDEEVLPRMFKATAAMASAVGALRDAYPGIRIEERSLAVALVEAVGTSRYRDADALLEALLELVRNCPNDRTARINTMLFTIAPTFMKIQ